MEGDGLGDHAPLPGRDALMARTLWRLESLDAAPRDPALLAAGLRLHLAYADLTSVLVQIGNVQQAYVCLAGCAGCHLGRHALGCRAELLRRLLAVSWGPSDLVPVPLGLLRRPYRQVVHATPTRQAVPFVPADLAVWAEARVVLHWARTTHGLRAAALLAAGDGPDLAEMVRARDWTARVLPAGLGTRLACRALPPPVWFGRAWSGAPALLVPQVALVERVVGAHQVLGRSHR